MKLKHLILSTSLAVGSLFASAQEEVTEYVYNPNWYVQGQFGAQETLGETSFGKLLAPNAQITLGYNFNPFVGVRLAVNGWQSKGASTIFDTKYNWKWNYMAPTVEGVFNMTNILGGYNPTRLVDVDVFAGIGVNVGWNNKEANTINAAFSAAHDGIGMLPLLWDGTKARFVGKFGAAVNFNVSERVALGLELSANVLPDGYNSKKAHNADWYFNGLVGVKYTFGPKYTKTTRVIPAPEPQIIERVVEKIVEVEKPVPTPVVEEAEIMQRNIFFKISTFEIRPDELKKVEEVAQYMKQHPRAKVTVTGYADKGTGTMAINLRLSKQRAEAVVNCLVKKFGVSRERIYVASMGEVEDQPFDTPEQNRVAICIVER